MKVLSKIAKNRTIRAGGITSFGFLLGQLIRLGGNLVLTRLLVPDMFGVMSVALVVLTGVVMLSDVGVRQYIIRSKDGLDPVTLNTAWVVQIIRGSFLFVIVEVIAIGIYVLASNGLIPADATYAHPELPYVLAALGLIPLLQGLESTKQFVLNRDLSMHLIVVVEIVSQVIALVVMIILALAYESVWALVTGALLSNVSKVVMTHFFLPGERNRL
jgi:O-antigen/teichoic acid export membrane protein